MAMPIRALRDLLGVYSLGTHGCVDKRDMVDRLIASGAMLAKHASTNFTEYQIGKIIFFILQHF